MPSGVANQNPAMVMTPQQIASLPPDQAAPYLRGMSPEQQAMVAQARQDMLLQANRRFMRQSVEKIAYCPVSGGSGTTAAYSAGTTLVFDFPVVGSGYAKGILITYNLTLTLGGTSPVVQANQGAPFNLFSELLINYNGAQCRLHPYILKVLDMILGFTRGAQNAVVGGQVNNTINTQLLGFNSGGSLPVTTGSTWQGKIYMRFNVLGEDTIPGILPVMGVGNKPQLKLTCAPNTLSYDPLLSPVSTVSGTSVTASFAGNVNVDMIYLDGTTMSDPSGLTVDAEAEPTLQYYWDTPLNPLTANTLNRQHIATLLEHWVVISLLLDANNTTAIPNFINPNLSNLTQFQLSADSVGQQNFQSWNVSNNISVYDFYHRRRLEWGQDLDPGVIVWINAPTRNVINTDNRNGTQVLNMQAGGFPATTHAYQVSSVSGGTAPTTTPRVETFVISLNYNGLKIA